MSDLNFKNKYLKYKKKYLDLHKSLTNNKHIKPQYGGNKLSFISREDFNRIFLSKGSGLGGLMYLIEFTRLYKSIESKPDLNILIGASNMNDYDFKRFTNSDFFLFIDKFIIDNNNEELYRERLYDMFTISNDTWYNYGHISMNLTNMVNMICADINTAYFLDRGEHLELASKALKIGGRFIFYHVEHTADPCILEGSKLKSVITGEFVPDELTSLLTIDRENKTVKVLGDENILKLFKNYTSLLACSFPIKITELTKLGPDGKIILAGPRDFYKDNLYDAYHRFLTLSARTFNVNLHTFNFMNFTYPVPIPNNTIHLDFVRFIINYVMTESERNNYLTNKTLTDAKLEELINRVNTTQSLVDKIKSQKIKDFVYDRAKFKTNVISEFKENFHYYELIKKS
jgi:hypothetical protein